MTTTLKQDQIQTEAQIIDLKYFDQVVMQTGEIINVAEVPRSSKLLAFDLQCGDYRRRILSGIKEHYASPSDLIGKHVVFVANFLPRKIMGEISEGMLLTVENADGLVSLLFSPDALGNGSRVL